MWSQFARLSCYLPRLDWSTVQSLCRWCPLPWLRPLSHKRLSLLCSLLTPADRKQAGWDLPCFYLVPLPQSLGQMLCNTFYSIIESTICSYSSSVCRCSLMSSGDSHLGNLKFCTTNCLASFLSSKIDSVSSLSLSSLSMFLIRTITSLS